MPLSEETGQVEQSMMNIDTTTHQATLQTVVQQLYGHQHTML